MTTFQLFPIATADCDSLNQSHDALKTTDTVQEAKAAASELSGEYPWGVGILDTTTGAIDVGFGFGVPCPSFAEE